MVGRIENAIASCSRVALDIAIEEPFVGASGTSALKTYSVFVMLITMLTLMGALPGGSRIWFVAPTALKKFVGVRTKNLIAREAYRRWHYMADDDNLVDAYVLARWVDEIGSKKQKPALTTPI